ncbi:MAG: preprotein translocase subunit YajC [Alphaproteobacteria bacterium]
MLISPAYAQAAGGGDLISAFLPLILIFVVFYFLLIRPQQKKQKAHKEKVNAVQKGDYILLAGGMYGRVTRIDGDSDCLVELAPGIEVRVLKQTLLDVIDKDKAPKMPAAKTPSKASAKSTKGKAATAKTRAKPAAAAKSSEAEEAVDAVEIDAPSQTNDQDNDKAADADSKAKS